VGAGATSPTSLQDALRSAVQALGAAAREHRISVVEDPIAAASLDGDVATRIQRAFEDLAQAALRLSAAGDTLRIGAQITDGDEGVVVTVGPASARVRLDGAP
jgi:signal transduction histidine kinase